MSSPSQGASLIILQAARTVASYYSNSIRKALVHLFPDIQFDKNKISLSMPSMFFQCIDLCLIIDLEHHWTDPSNRKQFFLDFAKAKGFDPYNPESWYTVSSADIAATKVLHLRGLCIFKIS